MKSLLVIPLLFVAALAHAEAPKPGDDPIGARLFPPELIMKHQRELAIDDKQRDAIVAEVQKTQAQLVPLQWQMQGASEAMAKLLDAPSSTRARCSRRPTRSWASSASSSART